MVRDFEFYVAVRSVRYLNFKMFYFQDQWLQ